MSAFTLKIIALVTMIIDHIGMVFFPQVIWLRYIGRLAMPIYAFLLVLGYRYTKNYTRYVLRMAFFAVLSEFPYDYLFRGKWLEFDKQNVLFTLLCALLIMRALDVSAKKSNIFLFMAALALVFLPYYWGFSYGAYGVGMVLCFFLFQKYRGIDVIAFAGLTYARNKFIGNEIQMWSIAAGIPILLYNGKRGRYSLKYFFYLSYPIHLFLIALTQYLLDNHLLPFV